MWARRLRVLVLIATVLTPIMSLAQTPGQAVQLAAWAAVGATEVGHENR